MISDSWYIGAFGRWWRGGVIEAWYQDVIARSKDEESWSSGILAMKNLDMLNDFNGELLHYSWLVQDIMSKNQLFSRSLPRIFRLIFYLGVHLRN